MAKDSKTPSKSEFEKANKKQLRAWCDRYGIKWSKLTDDEAALRSKLQKFFAKAAAAEAEENEEEEETSTSLPHNGKRAPIDPKTGKQIDCFGWFFDEESSLCTKKCPHREACEPLSAKAPSPEEAEEDIEADEEAEGADEEGADDARKAHVKKKAKASREEEDEEVVVKPSKKKAKKDDDEEEEEEASDDEEADDSDDDEEEMTILTKRGAITEDSILEVLITEQSINDTDFDGNDAVESIYRRLLKSASKSPSKKVKASLIKKITASALEIEDEKELNSTFKDIVRAMDSAGEIKLIK